jgi:hypothetical protein
MPPILRAATFAATLSLATRGRSPGSFGRRPRLRLPSARRPYRKCRRQGSTLRRLRPSPARLRPRRARLRPDDGPVASKDPTGFRGGINRYSYASSDLINRTDPRGTDDSPWDPTGLIPSPAQVCNEEWALLGTAACMPYTAFSTAYLCGRLTSGVASYACSSAPQTWSEFGSDFWLLVTPSYPELPDPLAAEHEQCFENPEECYSSGPWTDVFTDRVTIRGFAGRLC